MSSEDSNKANVSPDHQLLMFYSQESLFTRRAAPCIADIEEKLGAPIFKLEAIENKYNKMLYETFNPGLKKCHGCKYSVNISVNKRLLYIR